MSDKSYDAPNYTQIPNSFLDKQMPVIHSMAELKVCLAVMRQTSGWHKQEDELSLSQLVEKTGMHRETVSTGIQEALKHRILVRRKVGRSYAYRLNVEDSDTDESNSRNIRPKVVKNSDHSIVGDSDPQKKGTKEKKENATLSGADAPADDSRTANQRLTDDLYRRMRDTHKVRFTKQQYEFHLGRFKEMLAKDEPGDDELDAVIAYMVERLPAAPKLDGVLALQQVRMGRHDGSAWAGPAPWAGQSNLPEHEQWKEGYYKNWKNYSDSEPTRELTEEEKAQVEARRKELLERIGFDA